VVITRVKSKKVITRQFDSGVMLPVVEKISYLGVDISSGRSLGLCMHSRRMKFFRAFNALYAKLGRQNVRVRCKITMSDATPPAY